MSVAIFQCWCNDRVKQLVEELRSNAVFKRCEFYPHNTLLFVSFRNHWVPMWMTCMQTIEAFDHQVAFVGIDETTDEPRDYYSLDAIGSMPRSVEYRSELQQTSFNRLKAEFFDAVYHSKYTYEYLLKIAEHCLLSPYVKDSGIECIARYVEYLSNNEVSREYANRLLEKNMFEVPHMVDGCLLDTWTTIRVMAVICYLRGSKFKKKGGVLIGKQLDCAV